MSDFVFREALPEDKEAVLGMRDVYHGCDFLHYRYDEFQRSRHICPYLCEVNGNVVGFVSMIIVDNGETAVNRAVRVREDFEGKGVYRYLVSEVVKLHKKQGRVKRHAMCTTLRLPEPNLLCMERTMNVYTFTLEIMDNGSKHLQTNNDIQISEELPRMVLYQPYAKYLFPQNRLVVDWIGCRLLETNIPLLPKSRFASNLKESTDGNITGLLSAFDAFKGTKEYDVVCNLDVYGTDMRTLEEHVAIHLKYLHEKMNGFVIIWITFEQTIQSDIPDKLFAKIGAERIVAGPLSDPIAFLYERNT